MTTETKTPACLGAATCAHFRGTYHDGETATIQHGENPEQQRTALVGVFPLGLCTDGHDVALERWAHEVMELNGCEPADPEGED